jgi:alpha-D-xyloside xylohydrolase
MECVANYSKNDLPLDTIWNDIDYMDHYKDFTVAPDRFPAVPFKQFVDDLHTNNQHYIVITDPGIKIESDYDAFEEGMSADVFIKDAAGKQPAVGQVWPGYTTFPDWTHPNTEAWWTRQIARFHDVIPFDGLWIDMNEASSFCWGPQCPLFNSTLNPPQSLARRQRDTSTFDPNNPPFKVCRPSVDYWGSDHFSHFLSIASHSMVGSHFTPAHLVSMPSNMLLEPTMCTIYLATGSRSQRSMLLRV